MQVINTNMYSLMAQRSLNKNSAAINTAMERLSSGLRINSAKDDAAGLAIASRMESDSRGLAVAMRNVGDAQSYAQTAEGALGTASDMLQRMHELAVQSLNGTIGNTERSKLDTEFATLSSEFTKIQDEAKLNNQSVFGTFSFQTGAGATDTMAATFSKVTLAAGTAVDTAANAATALTNIETAMDSLNTNRATIGATQGALEFRTQYLQVAKENQDAARSRIMDADFAAETAALSKAQVLQQAGIAMLAQANAMPQNILSLLR